MPEFILDTGDQEATRQFKSLDEFTQGYIEAAFFTSTGSDNEAEGLGEASFAEIAPESLCEIIADCAKWQEANKALLDQVYAGDNGYNDDYHAGLAGMDYWYTRNGHGTGFWDRGSGEIGDSLANACRHQEVNMVRGDSGAIYFE